VTFTRWYRPSPQRCNAGAVRSAQLSTVLRIWVPSIPRTAALSGSWHPDRRLGAQYSGDVHEVDSLCEQIEDPRFYVLTQSLGGCRTNASGGPRTGDSGHCRRTVSLRYSDRPSRPKARLGVRTRGETSSPASLGGALRPAATPPDVSSVRWAVWTIQKRDLPLKAFCTLEASGGVNAPIAARREKAGSTSSNVWRAQ
jgi:hypothetical protein